MYKLLLVKGALVIEANRKSPMESVDFHATMQILNSSKLDFRLDCGPGLLIFFHLLAVRPAQASFRPYGLKDAVLQKSGTLFFLHFRP